MKKLTSAAAAQTHCLAQQASESLEQNESRMITGLQCLRSLRAVQEEGDERDVGEADVMEERMSKPEIGGYAT
jgi:hypothetical protein